MFEKKQKWKKLKLMKMMCFHCFCHSDERFMHVIYIKANHHVKYVFNFKKKENCYFDKFKPFGCHISLIFIVLFT